MPRERSGFACSGGGGDPYGAGSFERTSASCNTLECYSAGTCVFPTDLVTSGAPVAPGSMPDWQAPEPLYAGVYDLTGNVAEWDNSCDGEVGAEDRCAFRGGAYDLSPTTCDFAPVNGIRCTSPVVT